MTAVVPNNRIAELAKKSSVSRQDIANDFIKYLDKSENTILKQILKNPDVDVRQIIKRRLVPGKAGNKFILTQNPNSINFLKNTNIKLGDNTYNTVKSALNSFKVKYITAIKNKRNANAAAAKNAANAAIAAKAAKAAAAAAAAAAKAEQAPSINSTIFNKAVSTMGFTNFLDYLYNNLGDIEDKLKNSPDNALKKCHQDTLEVYKYYKESMKEEDAKIGVPPGKVLIYSLINLVVPEPKIVINGKPAGLNELKKLTAGLQLLYYTQTVGFKNNLSPEERGGQGHHTPSINVYMNTYAAWKNLATAKARESGQGWWKLSDTDELSYALIQLKQLFLKKYPKSKSKTKLDEWTSLFETYLEKNPGKTVEVKQKYKTIKALNELVNVALIQAYVAGFKYKDESKPVFLGEKGELTNSTISLRDKLGDQWILRIQISGQENNKYDTTNPYQAASSVLRVGNKSLTRNFFTGTLHALMHKSAQLEVTNLQHFTPCDRPQGNPFSHLPSIKYNENNKFNNANTYRNFLNCHALAILQTLRFSFFNFDIKQGTPVNGERVNLGNKVFVRLNTETQERPNGGNPIIGRIGIYTKQGQSNRFTPAYNFFHKGEGNQKSIYERILDRLKGTPNLQTVKWDTLPNWIQGSVTQVDVRSSVILAYKLYYLPISTIKADLAKGYNIWELGGKQLSQSEKEALERQLKNYHQNIAKSVNLCWTDFYKQLEELKP